MRGVSPRKLTCAVGDLLGTPVQGARRDSPAGRFPDKLAPGSAREPTQRRAKLGYETVIWEQAGAVGRLTLNRPESLNAWTAEFGRELRQVVEGEAADAEVRAVLVTGAGR